MNFWETLRKAFLQNIFGRLLLKNIIANGCFCIFGNCLVKTFFTSFVLFETKIKGCSNQSRLNKNVPYHKVLLGEDRRIKFLQKSKTIASQIKSRRYFSAHQHQHFSKFKERYHTFQILKRFCKFQKQSTVHVLKKRCPYKFCHLFICTSLK